jgi:hypothetical protein
LSTAIIQPRPCGRGLAPPRAALGLTTDHNAWVNISDGGYFENLRRCATIIAVDGSAAPSFHCDDLGNAIRKIEFPDGVSIFEEPCPASRHCAVGRIRYKAVDGNDVPDGILIYIMTSLTGNESQDVRNYAPQRAISASAAS